MYSEYQDILYIEYARCLKCIQLFDAFFQFPWMRYYEFFLIMIIFIKILLKNILFGIEEEKTIYIRMRQDLAYFILLHL